jgi:hypothetical protein|tara:strand:+ start:4671 stop:4841 length:171 start_codon:yes stop_codon:yes gene_type:complete
LVAHNSTDTHYDSVQTQKINTALFHADFPGIALDKTTLLARVSGVSTTVEATGKKP